MQLFSKGTRKHVVYRHIHFLWSNCPSFPTYIGSLIPQVKEHGADAVAIPDHEVITRRKQFRLRKDKADEKRKKKENKKDMAEQKKQEKELKKAAKAAKKEAEKKEPKVAEKTERGQKRGRKAKDADTVIEEAHQASDSQSCRGRGLKCLRKMSAAKKACDAASEQAARPETPSADSIGKEKKSGKGKKSRKDTEKHHDKTAEAKNANEKKNKKRTGKAMNEEEKPKQKCAKKQDDDEKSPKGKQRRGIKPRMRQWPSPRSQRRMRRIRLPRPRSLRREHRSPGRQRIKRSKK